jgi:hypothetical protein
LLRPLLLIDHVNDSWRNIESTIKLFADECIKSNNYKEKLEADLNRLGDLAVIYAMKINPTKSKAICFTRARVKEPLNYTLSGIVIPEASSCKYLGIILRSDLIRQIKRWKKPGRHFILQCVF